MTETASDFLVQRMHEWGIRRIYGFPGDGINGVFGALARQRDKIEFIQARHEEEAAFMAVAHAKFTGEVGVCIATSGPGAIHLLNGLYDARKDSTPVMAIVGQQATTAMGSDYQQEVDLISLFKDVARDYVHVAMTPASIRHLVDQALRIAKADRAITCIILPNDVQEMEAVPSPPRAHGSTFTGVGYSTPSIVPKEADLQRAAKVLNEGKKGGDADRCRCFAGHRPGSANRRTFRRRRRQSAARQSRAARRPTVRHRFDRAAGHQTELGHDDELRHAAGGGQRVPLFRVLSRRRKSPGGSDRHSAA